MFSVLTQSVTAAAQDKAKKKPFRDLSHTIEIDIAGFSVMYLKKKKTARKAPKKKTSVVSAESGKKTTAKKTVKK